MKKTAHLKKYQFKSWFQKTEDEKYIEYIKYQERYNKIRKKYPGAGMTQQYDFETFKHFYTEYYNERTDKKESLIRKVVERQFDVTQKQISASAKLLRENLLSQKKIDGELLSEKLGIKQDLSYAQLFNRLRKNEDIGKEFWLLIDKIGWKEVMY